MPKPMLPVRCQHITAARSHELTLYAVGGTTGMMVVHLCEACGEAAAAHVRTLLARDPSTEALLTSPTPKASKVKR